MQMSEYRPHMDDRFGSLPGRVISLLDAGCGCPIQIFGSEKISFYHNWITPLRQPCPPLGAGALGMHHYYLKPVPAF
jgi:hypothetical protein